MAYLDNSATTRVLPGAAEKAAEMMTELYGNPSALHSMGYEAKKQMETARELIAGRLGALPEEIYFTGGGTEGNNMAVLGAASARGRRGNKVVTTAIEHPSVLNPAAELEKQGFEVVYLPPDGKGNIPLSELENAIDEKTVLVSMMLVNNEVGSRLPVEAAAKIIRGKKSPALLHSDAVQAFGKLEFSAPKLGADILTVSGHKIHAPKGVGALYIKKGVRILPRVFGGGQEKGMRPGTESVPLICAFGEAVRELPAKTQELTRALYEMLRDELSRIDGVTLNSPEDGIPYVINFSAGRVKAETMVHFLAQRDIYVSAGAACGRAKPSHVLESMGLPRERVASAVRVSFSRFNTPEDVQALVSGIKEGISSLAHF